MAAVDPAAVTALLDANSQPVTTVVPLLTALARSYTRGHGFDSDGVPNDEIAAVITLAAARLSANASQLPHTTSVGPLSQDLRGGFVGWSVAELAVLNRYRVRAL